MLAGALCLTGAAVQAQVNVGIKGGVSFTNISNIPYDLTRTTGHGGIYIEANLNRNWAIQPEILYAGMGDRYRLVPNGRGTEALSYVQIPVMFKYYPVRQFYVEFGPQLGLLTSAKEKVAGTSTDVKDGYNTADFALNFGLGFKVTPVIGFYFRYNVGLSNLQPDASDNYSNRGALLGMDIRLFSSRYSRGNEYSNPHSSPRRGGGRYYRRY